jgi:hypothetical protein
MDEDTFEQRKLGRLAGFVRLPFRLDHGLLLVAFLVACTVYALKS